MSPLSPIEPDNFDRVAKLLVDSGQVASFQEAEALLRTYRLQIIVGPAACAEPAWQAAALTAVNAGVRAMHGGVAVILAADEPCRVPAARAMQLSEALTRYGATITQRTEPDVPTIVLGESVLSALTGPVCHAVAGEWTAGVSPVAPVPGGNPNDHSSPSVLAAVMTAAMAVSECFQRLRGYAVATERTAGVSLWRPELSAEDSSAEGPPIRELPAGVWLLGLGHLGQAYAWLLSLLPYPLDGQRPLGLQDDDRLSNANRATSMLHIDGQTGTRKTRLVGETMEPLGWDTRLLEHRYLGGRLHGPGDPTVLLAGVDNLSARRLLDDTGFPVIIDAGLGAGPDGFLGMRIRRLPTSRSSQEIWSAPPPRSPTVAAHAGEAYRALEEQSGDRCGVEQLAGRTVATAFVGVTAACWAIGGLLRELHGGTRYELIDHTLRDPTAVVALPSEDSRPPRVSSVACVE